MGARAAREREASGGHDSRAVMRSTGAMLARSHSWLAAAVATHGADRLIAFKPLSAIKTIWPLRFALKKRALPFLALKNNVRGNARCAGRNLTRVSERPPSLQTRLLSLPA